MALSSRRQSAYLERIGLEGSPAVMEPSIAALGRLHAAHLEHVPFENLDIHLGRAIELDAEGILTKVVEDRRGGFCYELNGAFAELLGSLGYAVTLIEARAYEDGEPGKAFDHLCLLVDLDRQYLVDVGFGESFIEPIPFELDVDHHDQAGHFEITKLDDEWFELGRDGQPQYRFNTVARTLDEFEPGCHLHQTSQRTSFTRRPLATLATARGRVTLKGLELSETIDGERHVRPVDAGELRTELFKRLGIEVDPTELVAGFDHLLDDVLVDFIGVSEFDRAAYEVARTIPPGQVMTYGAVAKRLGQPSGAQAIGGAMGRNPVPLIVPCHRVVAADGNLGGFSANGGTVAKRRLLEIEGAPINRSLF